MSGNMQTVRQRLREARKTLDTINKPNDTIHLVVKTPVGTLRNVLIPLTVQAALCTGVPLPSYFLSGVKITEYLLADSFENELRKNHGAPAAKKGVARLKAYLESCKAIKVEAVGKATRRTLVLD